MPRTGRGGPRQMAVGDASGNRTDLNEHVPIVAVPGGEYGSEAAQVAAQRAVPMAPTPSAVPSGSMLPLAQTMRQVAPKAGSLPFLQPSTRQDPITSGLPTGPGPGPEVMTRAPVIPPQPVSRAFDEIAQSPNASSQVSDLAQTARLLGL